MKLKTIANSIGSILDKDGAPPVTVEAVAERFKFERKMVLDLWYQVNEGDRIFEIFEAVSDYRFPKKHLFRRKLVDFKPNAILDRAFP